MQNRSVNNKKNPPTRAKKKTEILDFCLKKNYPVRPKVIHGLGASNFNSVRMMLSSCLSCPHGSKKEYARKAGECDVEFNSSPCPCPACPWRFMCSSSCCCLISSLLSEEAPAFRASDVDVRFWRPMVIGWIPLPTLASYFSRSLSSNSISRLSRSRSRSFIRSCVKFSTTGISNDFCKSE